jgi:hypothetical protein
MNPSEQLSHSVREALLDALESIEDPLLAWGVYDGALSEEEVEICAREVLASCALPAELDDALDAMDELQDAGLLLRVPDGYRTRMAEHLRLLRSLRQLFPRRDGALGEWRGAPGLVDSIRYVRRPRRYPRRDVDAALMTGELTRADSQARAVLRTLTTDANGYPWQLAGFQERATRELLAKLDDRRGGGVIVGAGTGSGKTLAFYLPAFTHVAGELNGPPWTKVLALYPRNELLKDQLQSAVEQAIDLVGPLATHGTRPVRIGAIFGAVPQASWALKGDYGWPKIASDIWRCPYLRCPQSKSGIRCHGDLVIDEDELNRDESTLRCSDCRSKLSPDVFAITRAQMRRRPPDMLFSSTEMLSRSLLDPETQHVFGMGAEKGPQLVLLDEVHTYGGTTGAMTAVTLRRWRSRVSGKPVFVGLSATLLDASRFFGDLVGVHADQVTDIQPDPDELIPEGAEYLIVARSDPTSRTAMLSTSIQTAMLVGRTLDNRQAGRATGVSGGFFGTRTFLFTDDLDVTNRLYFDLLDAEGQRHRRKGNQPYKKSLAHLRSPEHGDVHERAQAGQVWELAERTGHDLGPNAHLAIGRTTSQDAGLDESADVIVATSSLEVGVDDDAVGAVMQHKAPRDAAAFLQRQGRAGRKRGTRPITTVVVSDYGRDREAFEGWDRLVDPVLEPSALPVGNTHVMRMQAAQETLVWAAMEVQNPRQLGNLWSALLPKTSPNFAALARRRVRDRLNSLLHDVAEQQSLARHLAKALGIDPAVVEDILWRPPRPILLGLVPGLIRRLDDEWAVATSPALEDAGASQPMPSFIPKALFAKLALPETVAELPPEPWENEPPTEQLGVIQGIRELCPGRITKRFAINSDMQRAWVDPSPSEDGLEVSTFVQLRQLDGDVPVDGHRIPLVRPLRVVATRPGEDLRDSSRGHPRWASDVVVRGEGLTVRTISASPISKVLGTIEAFLHRDQRHVEVRRGAWATDVTLQYVSGDKHSAVIPFVDEGRRVALGAAFDVDAIRLRPQLPSTDTVWGGAMSPGLRTDRLRDLITRDEDILELIGPFNAERLVDLLLLTVAMRVKPGAEGPEQAWTSIGDSVEAELGANVGLLLADPASADHGTELAGGTLGEDLREAVSNPVILDALTRHVSALWQGVDDDARALLHRRLLRTVGEAVLTGARLLCPEHDASGVIVDVEPGGETDTVWISEEDVGGGGLIEAFVDAMSSDPGRFLRLVHAGLRPGPDDLTAAALRTTVAAVSKGTGPLATAFAGFRAARGAHVQLTALGEVRKALVLEGVPATPTVVFAIANRLLRAGSDATLDREVQATIEEWDKHEAVAGFEIPLRIWTLLDARLSSDSLDAGHYDRMQTVLWPRGSTIRNRRLASYNPFDQPPAPAPDVLLDLLEADDTEPVDADAGWSEVASRLASTGEVSIKGPAADARAVVNLLATAAVASIDIGFLRLHARPSEVRVETDQTVVARLDLPDVGQHARHESAAGATDPATGTRRINTSGKGPGPVRDVMHTVFVSELLRPSSPLWIVSAWLSDVVVVDNRGGELLSLAPALPIRELRLVEVLTEIVSRGGEVEVVVREAPHNRSVVGRLREIAARSHTGSLRIQERPALHDKMLATANLLVEGSMNFTHRGAEVNEEGVRISANPSDVAEQRMELRSRFGETP